MAQCAKARFAVVDARIFGLKKDALEDQSGIFEVHTVIFKVAQSFCLIPLDAHHAQYTNVDTTISVKIEEDRG